MEFSLDYIAGFFDGEGSIGMYTTGKDTVFLKTQLTQNESKFTRELFDYLVQTFGGAYSGQITLSGKTKFNWQLSGEKAGSFLEVIKDHLFFKKEQAELAIHWINNRSPLLRNKRGQIIARSTIERSYDRDVANKLKEMKRG